MSVVTRIRTSQKLTVPHAPEEVWAVLADVASYPEWWPSKLGVEVLHHQGDLLGAEFEVRPLMGRVFRIRFEELDPMRSMRLRFFGGSLEGPGGFHLESLEGATLVRYEMDVFARGFDVAVMSQVLPLEQIHGSRMRSVLRSLAGRLKALRKAAEKEAAREARSLDRERALLHEAEEVARERALQEAAARAAAVEAERRAAEEEAARLAAAEAARRLAEEEAAARAAAQEAERRAAEDEAARVAAAEAARQAVEKETARLAAEEATRRVAEEAAAARAAAAEAERRAAEEEAARVAAAEAARQAVEKETARLAAEEAARKLAEEAAAARAAAEEAERRAAEEEAARLAAEEAARKLAEEAAAARAAAEEAERRAAEEEAARLAAEEAARKLAEEAAAARAAAEEAERRAAEEHAARVAAEDAAKERAAEAAAARLAAEEAERRAAEEHAVRLAGEEEARRRAAEEWAARAAAEEARSRGAEAPRVDEPATASRLRPLWARVANWLTEPAASPATAAAPAGESAPQTEPSPKSSNFDIARQYLDALSSRATPEEIGRYLTPEVADEEFPHRFLDSVRTRGFAGLLEARAAALVRFSSERYELAGATGGGSQVAMEVRWKGSVATTGEGFVEGHELDARIAFFLKFAEGRIVRQRRYACFEPWSTKAERILTLDERVAQAGQSAKAPSHRSAVAPFEANASNFEIARRYLAALEARADAETIARFYAPEAVQDEFPNRFLPGGAHRDLAAIRIARSRGLSLMASESYELLGATGGGSMVALEVAWSGVVANGLGLFTAGERLEARLGIFLRFREGLIVSQRNYDCAWRSAGGQM